MKRIKLDLWDCYVYFLWMMVVHRLDNSAIVVINGFAKNTLQLSWAVREPMIYVILAVMPHLAFVWLAYRAADKQYLVSGDRLLWMKSGWLYMLPGELIRLVVSATTVNTVRYLPWKFGIAFAPINHVIFTATYGKWSGREYEVSTYADNVMFIPQDYLAYIVCHLLYLIPYMAAQLLIYFFMWKLVGRKHASMRGANNPC